MHRGYIKLWRKTLDSSICQNSHCFHLAIYLTMKANYKSTKFIFNKQEITVDRGQCIIGRAKLSLETGITQQSIRTTLHTLENIGFLTTKSTNRFSIITICNYETYQSQDEIDNQQITNSQPTTNQQLTTSKEVKRIKKNIGGKDSPLTDYPLLTNPEFAKAFADFLTMRVKIKAPATHRAQQLLLKQLHKYEAPEAIAMLEQSITRSWRGIFPLKYEQQEKKAGW